MESIVTLTLNPAIDISTSVDEIVPVRKLRCAEARRDPGRGGIEVARVVRRLGGLASAIYPAGGSTGNLLRRLVEREGIQSVAISVAEETRESFTVLDQKSGQQYRFVLPDSFVGGLVWALASGRSTAEAFRWGARPGLPRCSIRELNYATPTTLSAWLNK